MGMSKDFLSQDEVDALLKGVTGEQDEPEAPEQGSGARPYNFATQERIVRGRMPTLEIINERFARLLRIGMFNFARRSAEISVNPVRLQKYGEFVRNLVVPTNLNLMQVRPLRGTALFVFNPNLVFLIVDSMFGGDGRFHSRVEGRDFSQTEQRIIHKLLEVVIADYKKAWATVRELHFEYVRSEMNTQFANIATPNEVVITTTFNVDLGNGSGDIHICMPYAMIEPIREILSSALQGDHLDTDKRWLNLLSRQVQEADVELVAQLGRTRVPLKGIMGMKVGDVIPIEVPDTILAHVDGVPVMQCRFGVSQGQYAVSVEQILGRSPGDVMEG